MQLKIILAGMFLLCCSTVKASTITLQQDQAATLDNTSTINIEISDAPEFYAAEAILEYDPSSIEIIDNDESKPGIQIQHSDLFPKDSSFVLANEVKDKKIHFASTLVSPSKQHQGSGRIASFTIKALKTGKTTVKINKAELGNSKGNLLATTFSPNYEIQLYKNTQAAKKAQPNITNSDNTTLFIMAGIIITLLLLIVALQIRNKK